METIAEILLPNEGVQQILRMVAPGTPLREGLDNVLRAKTGALIVVGENPAINAIIDGGFRLDTEFTPASLYELAKMGRYHPQQRCQAHLVCQHHAHA